jgi:hypothetical protein
MLLKEANAISVELKKKVKKKHNKKYSIYFIIIANQGAISICFTI